MNHQPFSAILTLVFAIVLAMGTSTAWAQFWDEMGDAGSLRQSAQVPSGTGPLESIDGEISNNNDVDVYRIFLTGGQTFSASTHPDDGGDANFDTMLFLFDAEGYGVYYDDDIDFTYLAQLPAHHELTPNTPGYYYLAITSWENDAQSSSGQIFPIDDVEFHVQGPQQPGGSNPLSGWDGEGFESGTYHIVLTGAEYAHIDEPHDVEPAMSASWYYEAESGHGIMIHLIDEQTAWMCWFTFDLDGNRTWICAVGEIDGGMIVFEEAFTVEGGNFPPLFDPSQIEEVPWGSIIVIFTGCNSGRMEWTTNAAGFVSGSMPLSRLTTLWGSLCE